MCIEYAFKRGGIPIIRNFLHQAEGVTAYNCFSYYRLTSPRGLPEGVASRLKIYYKMRKYQEGKEVARKYVNNIIDGFPIKGDTK